MRYNYLQGWNPPRRIYTPSPSCPLPFFPSSLLSSARPLAYSYCIYLPQYLLPTTSVSNYSPRVSPSLSVLVPCPCPCFTSSHFILLLQLFLALPITLPHITTLTHPASHPLPLYPLITLHPYPSPSGRNEARNLAISRGLGSTAVAPARMNTSTSDCSALPVTPKIWPV